MSITKTESLWLVVYLLLSSSGFSQTRVPLPPDAEQLLAWRVWNQEWFSRWETADMRCNIDDPTLYRIIGIGSNVDIRSETEELEKRIVHDLNAHGWSRMKPATGNDRGECFQRHDSFVRIYKICASRSCTSYDGLTLTYYLRIPPGSPPQ